MTDTISKQTRWSIIIIILFHAVGVAGFIIPATRDLFTDIVPLHLLLMLGVILRNHQGQDNLNTFFWIMFFAGFCIEWLGVRTGDLFGYYAYGSTLGFRVVDIPPMIGVNWFLLIYSAGITMRRLPFNKPVIRIAIGAALLVLLDILIEPVAVRFDYWHWAAGVIPLQNYVCWYIVSFILLVIFELFKFQKQNKTATILLISQFVFFAILNVWLIASVGR